VAVLWTVYDASLCVEVPPPAVVTQGRPGERYRCTYHARFKLLLMKVPVGVVVMTLEGVVAKYVAGVRVKVLLPCGIDYVKLATVMFGSSGNTTAVVSSG